jgi:hypothetical protein
MSSLALDETDKAEYQADDNIEDGPHRRRLLLSEGKLVLLK